jgi:hypothetical protein
MMVARGNEEGEIEYHNPRCCVTFGGPKSTELEGSFEDGAFGACEFTGVKVRMVSSTAFRSY